MDTDLRYIHQYQPTNATPSEACGLKPCAHAIVGRRRRAVNLIVATFVLAGISPGYVSADFTKSADPGTGDGLKMVPRKRAPIAHRDDEAVAKADRLYHEATVPQDLDHRWRHNWVAWISLMIVIGSLAACYCIFRVRSNRRS